MEAYPVGIQSSGDRTKQRAVINNNLGGGTIHAMYASVNNYHCNPAASEAQSRNFAPLGPTSFGRISPATNGDFHHRSSVHPAGRDFKAIHQLAAEWQSEPPLQPAYLQFQQANAEAPPEHPFYQHAYHAQYHPYQSQPPFNETIGYLHGHQDCTSQHQFFQNPQLKYLQHSQQAHSAHCTQGEYYQAPQQPQPQSANLNQPNGQAREQGFQQEFALAFGAPDCVANQEVAPPAHGAAERERTPNLCATINDFELQRSHFDRPLGCRDGEPVGPAAAQAQFEQVGESARPCAGSFATLVSRPTAVGNQWAPSGEAHCKHGPVAALGIVVDCFGAGARGEREFACALPAANSDPCTSSAGPPSRPAGRNERQPALFAPSSSTPSAASATKPTSSTKRVRKARARARAPPRGRLVSGPNGTLSRRKNATRETTAMLKDWLDEHGANPYPTKGEKIMLSIITKMNLTQVSTWFANARRRLKKENKAQPWNTFNTCHSGPGAASAIGNGSQPSSSLASSNALRLLMKGGESLDLPPAPRQISASTSTCARDRQPDTSDGQPSSSITTTEKNDESNK